MCTVLLPPGVNPVAVDIYIISNWCYYQIQHLTNSVLKGFKIVIRVSCLTSSVEEGRNRRTMPQQSNAMKAANSPCPYGVPACGRWCLSGMGPCAPQV